MSYRNRNSQNVVYTYIWLYVVQISMSTINRRCHGNKYMAILSPAHKMPYDMVIPLLSPQGHSQHELAVWPVLNEMNKEAEVWYQIVGAVGETLKWHNIFD